MEEISTAALGYDNMNDVPTGPAVRLAWPCSYGFQKMSACQ